jgi:hypothetical protein
MPEVTSTAGAVQGGPRGRTSSRPRRQPATNIAELTNELTNDSHPITSVAQNASRAKARKNWAFGWTSKG